jgi:hypothetical protein
VDGVTFNRLSKFAHSGHADIAANAPKAHVWFRYDFDSDTYTELLHGDVGHGGTPRGHTIVVRRLQ